MNRRKLGLWTLGTAGVFLLAWQQLQSWRTGYELERTRQIVGTQRERNASLAALLEQQTAPESLAVLARSRLGMRPPSPEALVVLGEPAVRPQRLSAGRLARVFKADFLLSRLNGRQSP